MSGWGQPASYFLFIYSVSSENLLGLLVHLEDVSRKMSWRSGLDVQGLHGAAESRAIRFAQTGARIRRNNKVKQEEGPSLESEVQPGGQW